VGLEAYRRRLNGKFASFLFVQKLPEHKAAVEAGPAHPNHTGVFFDEGHIGTVADKAKIIGVLAHGWEKRLYFGGRKKENLSIYRR
jgi:hypothetical protein